MQYTDGTAALSCFSSWRGCGLRFYLASYKKKKRSSTSTHFRGVLCPLAIPLRLAIEKQFSVTLLATSHCLLPERVTWLGLPNQRSPNWLPDQWSTEVHCLCWVATPSLNVNKMNGGLSQNGGWGLKGRRGQKVPGPQTRLWHWGPLLYDLRDWECVQRTHLPRRKKRCAVCVTWWWGQGVI